MSIRTEKGRCTHQSSQETHPTRFSSNRFDLVRWDGWKSDRLRVSLTANRSEGHSQSFESGRKTQRGRWKTASLFGQVLRAPKSKVVRKFHLKQPTPGPSQKKQLLPLGLFDLSAFRQEENCQTLSISDCGRFWQFSSCLPKLQRGQFSHTVAVTRSPRGR